MSSIKRPLLISIVGYVSCLGVFLLPFMLVSSIKHETSSDFVYPLYSLYLFFTWLIFVLISIGFVKNKTWLRPLLMVVYLLGFLERGIVSADYASILRELLICMAFSFIPLWYLYSKVNVKNYFRNQSTNERGQSH